MSLKLSTISLHDKIQSSAGAFDGRFSFGQGQPKDGWLKKSAKSGEDQTEAGNRVVKKCSLKLADSGQSLSTDSEISGGYALFIFGQFQFQIGGHPENLK